MKISLIVSSIMKTHDLKPHQKELAKQISKLNKDNLYYLVSQPDERKMNHSINELKKHIKGGIRKYTKDFLLHHYRNGVESSLFQYVMFIEYPKDFYIAISKTDEDLFSMYKGVHFHLFISSTSKSVNIPQLFYYLLKELSSQKLKESSIRKYDYFKIEKLDERFSEYHTKQHYHYLDQDRLLINL